MPLDAREAIGIINTFQNMRLGREQAARNAEGFGRGMKEYQAAVEPGLEEMDPGEVQRMGAMGVESKALQGSLRSTQANRAQESELSQALQQYQDSLQIYDDITSKAEASGNPQAAEILRSGREYFRRGHEQILRDKHARFQRASKGVPVEEALTRSKKGAIPFSGN